MVHKFDSKGAWMETFHVGEHEYDVMRVGDKIVAFEEDMPIRQWNSMKDYRQTRKLWHIKEFLLGISP